MLNQIKGLHHVTSLSASATATDAFFTGPLGLRRVKKTVNFDAPEVYHLYYGDARGTPGTVMTYFPFPHAARGRRGTGEIGATAFAIPRGTRQAWTERLAGHGVAGVAEDSRFGEARLTFEGPDGDGFALVETDDGREPWTDGSVPFDMAIRGFHSVEMRLADAGATLELLRFMGYESVGSEGGVTRLGVADGTGANVVDIVTEPSAPASTQGAGSVHHVAFAVENRARQAEVREALAAEGWQVTPQIDRDYFWAIYFRSPGGVLFEVATNEPGFDRDEPLADLGRSLKLPKQHEHLRPRLERALEPLD